MRPVSGEIRLDPFDLAARERKDLGTVRLEEPARLFLEISYPDGAINGRAWIGVQRNSDGIEQVVLRGQTEASFPLTPGHYVVQLQSSRGVAVETRQEIDLLAGVTSRMKVVVRIPGE